VSLAALLAGAGALLRVRLANAPVPPGGGPTKSVRHPPAAPVMIDEPRADEKTEFILAMDGGDEVTERYVTRVLTAHAIWSMTQGSIGWSTSVRSSQRREAEKWLRKEDGLRGYVTWLPSGERELLPTPTRTTVSIGMDYTSALKSHPPDTVVGRILRSDDLRRELGGSVTAKVESVSWVVRPTVTDALKSTTCIVGTVALRDVTRDYPYLMHCAVFLEAE